MYVEPLTPKHRTLKYVGSSNLPHRAHCPESPASDLRPLPWTLQSVLPSLRSRTEHCSPLTTGPAYINFLSSIPRPLLEDFGAQTVASGTAEHLAQVYDQYLNFVVSEPDLFHLNMKGAYHTLNSGQTPDQELDAVMDRIVSGLFSVVVTMGVVPIIRCPKGGAAEDICAKLDRKLRDHILNSKTNLFSDQKSSSVASRPVLIIGKPNFCICRFCSNLSQWIETWIWFLCSATRG